MATGRPSRAGLVPFNVVSISKSFRIEMQIILARIQFHFGRKSISFRSKPMNFLVLFCNFVLIYKRKRKNGRGQFFGSVKMIIFLHQK